jgi:MipA family protein
VIGPSYSGSTAKRFRVSRDQAIWKSTRFRFSKPAPPARAWRRDSAASATVQASRWSGPTASTSGPVAKFIKAREEADHEELRGLGDVDWTLEVGVFAEYWPTDWLRGRIEVRRGFHGHEGFVADISSDLVLSLMERWTLSGGPRLQLADTAATTPYFGIDLAQSLASGLPVHDANGGLRSIGAGMQLRYQWNRQWAARAYAEYDRLMGDAASSPLVTERGSPNQLRFGLGVTYSFEVKLW